MFHRQLICKGMKVSCFVALCTFWQTFDWRYMISNGADHVSTCYYNTTSVCYLILCLTTSEDAQLQGSESSPTLKGSVLFSSQNIQHVRMQINNDDDSVMKHINWYKMKTMTVVGQWWWFCFSGKWSRWKRWWNHWREDGKPPKYFIKEPCKDGKVNDRKALTVRHQVNICQIQLSFPPCPISSHVFNRTSTGLCLQKYVHLSWREAKECSSAEIQHTFSCFWVDCDSSSWQCLVSTCLSLYYEGADNHHHCYSVVIQIYWPRQGYIRNWNHVVLRNPKTNEWLGHAPHICIGAPCPGQPNNKYRFQYPSKWV